MNKIRFITNRYIAMPFLAFSILGAVVSLVLMSIDEVKYLPVLIVYFVITGVASIGLFITTPIIRKKEIQIELGKYNSSIDDVEDKDEVEFFTNEEFNVTLSRQGIEIAEYFFDYSYFDIYLQTGNRLNLVNLNIMFFSNLKYDRDVDEKIQFSIPFSKELLYSIKEYHVPIENEDDMRFIINNKEAAFSQIYKYGRIKSGY